MTDLMPTKEPDKIMTGNSHVVKKYLADRLFYNWYIPAGTVLWSGNSGKTTPYSLTLSAPISKLEHGLKFTFDTSQRTVDLSGGGSWPFADTLTPAISNNLVVKSDLKTNQETTIGQVSSQDVVDILSNPIGAGDTFQNPRGSASGAITIQPTSDTQLTLKTYFDINASVDTISTIDGSYLATWPLAGYGYLSILKIEAY